MNFVEADVAGVWLIEMEPLVDGRGSFVRTFSSDIWELHGLPGRVVQANLSTNARRGTLRGMHYQAAPREEAKVVQCVRGAIFDVVVDLRPDSPTFCRWSGFTLEEDDHRALAIPGGCAHGFQTLRDDTHVYYLMSEYHDADLARGVRWDDPAFAINWPPADMRVISDRDRSFADFRP